MRAHVMVVVAVVLSLAGLFGACQGELDGEPMAVMTDASLGDGDSGDGDGPTTGDGDSGDGDGPATGDGDSGDGDAPASGDGDGSATGDGDSGDGGDLGGDAGGNDAGGNDSGTPNGNDSGTPSGDPPAGRWLLVGVSDFALIGRSGDGATWEICGDVNTGDGHAPNLLRNVAYGDGVFIAVGGDSNSMVMRSLDGVHWQKDLHPVDSCPSENFPASCTNWMGGIAYGNGVWLAGGGNGALMRSSDGGVTWTGLHPPGGMKPIRDMTFGGGRFVASTDGGFIYVSADDGDTWTSHSVWTAGMQVSYGGGVFIATGHAWNNGWQDACFVGENNGSSWSACAAPATLAYTVAYDGQRWLAQLTSGYAVSDDGKSWTSHSGAMPPDMLLFANDRWFGRTGTNGVQRASDPGAFQNVGSAPKFRAWTAGIVLADNEPVTGVPACQDNR